MGICIFSLQWGSGLVVSYYIEDFLAGTASRALTYIAQISASAAEYMTVFMIHAMLSTSPLLGGKETSLDMKKCPPAWLRALDSLRYDASLWTSRTMLDAS